MPECLWDLVPLLLGQRHCHLVCFGCDGTTDRYGDKLGLAFHFMNKSL